MLTTYYNFDDFYWDYWAAGKYSEDEYNAVCAKYNISRASPPDELIEYHRERQRKEAEERRVWQPEKKFSVGELGKLPPNFERTYPEP